MEIDQILYKSLMYPKKSWGKVLTLGAVVLVPSILILVIIILAGIFNNIAFSVIMAILGFIILILAFLVFGGYLLRVIKATLADIDDLPGFDAWGEILTDGLKVLVVYIVYSFIFGLIALIPFGILSLIGGYGLSGITGVSANPFSTAYNPYLFAGAGLALWVFYLALYIAYLILIAIMVVAEMVVPIALANMAYKGSLGHAFEFGEIRKRINSIRWGKVLIWVLGVQFIISVISIASAITILLLVGVILVPLLVIPYLAIFYARSTAMVFEAVE